MNHEPLREMFEQAAYQRYLDRRAAGLSSDCHETVMPADGLFWREPGGEYGVLMFNAAWWGWQAAWATQQALPSLGAAL